MCPGETYKEPVLLVFEQGMGPVLSSKEGIVNREGLLQLEGVHTAQLQEAEQLVRGHHLVLLNSSRTYASNSLAFADMISVWLVEIAKVKWVRRGDVITLELRCIDS